MPPELPESLSKTEYWMTVDGHARAELNDREIVLGPGNIVNIPTEALHRVENPGSELRVWIEIQRRDNFGEKNIVRALDDYGRA